jgi:hypothetical protein
VSDRLKVPFKLIRFSEKLVSELDEAWEVGLADAEARARAAGRSDIADYLALRSSNDLIRRIAQDWLLQMFVDAAGIANRAGASIQISRNSNHRFKAGNANMVGPMLTFGCGVRALTIEVGWPRTPRDGFIRGGGLACANIKHVGMKKENEELRLVVAGSGTPSWLVIAKPTIHVEPHEFHESHVKNHVAILLSTR